MDVEGSGRGCFGNVCLKELRKIMKTLCQDSRSPGRQLPFSWTEPYARYSNSCKS
jgi:hypothetical protein